MPTGRQPSYLRLAKAREAAGSSASARTKRRCRRLRQDPHLRQANPADFTVAAPTMRQRRRSTRVAMQTMLLMCWAEPASAQPASEARSPLSPRRGRHGGGLGSPQRSPLVLVAVKWVAQPRALLRPHRSPGANRPSASVSATTRSSGCGLVGSGPRSGDEARDTTGFDDVHLRRRATTGGTLDLMLRRSRGAAGLQRSAAAAATAAAATAAPGHQARQRDGRRVALARRGAAGGLSWARRRVASGRSCSTAKTFSGRASIREIAGAACRVRRGPGPGAGTAVGRVHGTCRRSPSSPRVKRVIRAARGSTRTSSAPSPRTSRCQRRRGQIRARGGRRRPLFGGSRRSRPRVPPRLLPAARRARPRRRRCSSPTRAGGRHGHGRRADAAGARAVPANRRDARRPAAGTTSRRWPPRPTTAPSWTRATPSAAHARSRPAPGSRAPKAAAETSPRAVARAPSPDSVMPCVEAG